VYSFYFAPLLEGFVTGAGLIIAIGAQNAFVLKQGILQNHVLTAVLISSVIDAIMISLGVGGFGQILTSNNFLLALARWGGAAFLVYYGLRSLRAVFKTESLKISKERSILNLKKTVTTALALSLLNPHLYLDTVVLLGSIGAQLPQASERFYFAIGAIIASFIWFFSLGFGARYLGPLFQKPMAWKILDFITGCVMLGIAIMLILGTEI
jgi:L-lysine exporter family protein LysE/ArgO